MKKKTLVIFILSILAIVIMAILYFNSFNLSLAINKLSVKNQSELFAGVNDNDHMFKIIITTKDNSDILACVEKNSFGIWNITHQSQPSDGDDIISIPWLKTAGFRQFQGNDEMVFETEWHHLYYGKNALAPIDIDYETLPLNVTLNVQQTNETYLLHFVSYGDPDNLNQLDVTKMLKEIGCIAK